MTRTRLNFIVDALGFAAFLFLTASGVLVRYVLPPGSGRWATLWGMDRHEWGALHFRIAVFLLAVMALHILLHWRWVVCVVRGRRTEASGPRLLLGAVALLALLGLAASPFFAPVERAAGGGHGRGGSRGAESRGSEAHGAEDLTNLGSMTLAEVERSSGVPAAHIIQKLGLPADTGPDERFGNLRREHGFSMEDVRRIVAEYGKEDPEGPGG